MSTLASSRYLSITPAVSYGFLSLFLASGCYSSPGAQSSATDPDSGETGGKDGAPAMRTPDGTSVYIKVRANGAPVAGATVTVHSQRFADPDVPDGPLPPAPVFTADGAGNVLLENLVAGEFVAQIESPGHAPASLVLELDWEMHAGVRVDLLPLAPPITFDVGLGATLEQDDVRVKIPANAVVDAQGQPVTGPVQVTITPIDPSKPMVALPWPLRGQRSGENDGLGVRLRTLYMADISMWRGAEHLQLAAGKTAEIEFTLPTDYDGLDLAAIARAGDEIPSWYYDFTAGTWKEEGMGRIAPSERLPGRLVWSTQLSHFSPHNCDIPIPPEEQTCVLVTVFDDEENPVPNMGVVLQCAQYIAQGVTDAEGQVCLVTQANDPVGVWVGSLNEQLTPEIVILPKNAGAVCPMNADDPHGCYELGIPYDAPKSDDCTPGSLYECAYNGDPGEEGEGICMAGKIYCDEFQQWGDVCEGEVKPQDEQCNTPNIDEDCDGEPNEAAMQNCQCDAKDPPLPCFPFQGAQLQGECHAGNQTCMNGVWSACMGAQGPAAEDCSSPADEDCDGNPGCGYATDAWSFGDASNQRAVDVAVSNNTIYVLGRFMGDVDVGGNQVHAGMEEHAFLASFAALDGAGINVIDLGSALQGDINLAVNAGNAIVVAGTLNGVLPALGVNLCPAVASDGPDLALVRLQGPGLACVSTRVLTGPGEQFATAVTLDDIGDVFIAGLYSAAAMLVLDQTALPATLPNEKDALVLRLNALNEVQWAMPLPAHLPLGDLRAPDLAVSNSAVLVAGVFQGTRDFATETLFADGNSDIFVTRHDPVTGAIIWAEDFGNIADEPGFLSLALGDDGSFALSGVIIGQVSFGLGAQHTVGEPNLRRVFLHKRSLVNEPQWTLARVMQDPQTLDGGHSVAIDDANRVVLVGTDIAGDLDLHLGKFSPQGEPYWDVVHTRLGDQVAAAVTIDGSARPIVVGRFTKDFDIDGLPIVLADNGVMDPFVLRLQP